MNSRYSENPPEFAQNADAIIFVVEGIIAKRPEKTLTPERLAVALRQEDIRLTLHMLGTQDALELVHKVNDFDGTIGARAEEVYEDLELAWAIESDRRSRPGVRELVMHLNASGLTVAFVSALSEKVARRVVASSLGGAPVGSVFGRQQPGALRDVYAAVHNQALESMGKDLRSITIVHESSAKHLPPEVGTSLLIVGKSFPEETDVYPDIIDLAAQCDLTHGEKGNIERQVRKRNRIIELERKSPKTDAEMAEFAELTGGIKVIGNTKQFGYIDDAFGLQNAALLKGRRRGAAKHQYLLEVVSTDATLIEIELRNWLIVHRVESFSSNDRLTFGQTVDFAERQGFPAHLIDRLRTFNKMRNDALHKLARGVASYQMMTDEYMSDCTLLFDIEDFVLESAPVIGCVAEAGF